MRYEYYGLNTKETPSKTMKNPEKPLRILSYFFTLRQLAVGGPITIRLKKFRLPRLNAGRKKQKNTRKSANKNLIKKNISLHIFSRWVKI